MNRQRENRGSPNRSAKELQDELKSLRSELKTVKKILASHEKINSNLHEVQELFSTVTSNILDGLVVMDWDGNFLFANKAAYRIIGIRPRKTPQGLNMTQFLHPDDLQRAIKNNMLTKAGNGGFIADYRIITPKGEHKWVEATGQRITFKGKDANLTTFRDITVHKRTDEQLRLSEKKFFSAFHSSPDSIVISKPQTGMIIDANKAFETWSGFERKDLIGKTSLDLDIWPDPQEREHLFNGLYAGKPVDRFETKLKKRNGEIRDMLISANLIDIDNEVYTISIVRDITDLRQAELALKESEERFRVLHDASFGGIGIHDKGIILDCNQGLADMTGFSMEELIGMNGLELIAPRWRDHVMQRILSGYEQPYDVEGIRKDKTIYNLEIQGKNIHYHGKPVRVTEFRDITVRKRVEDAFRESEERYKKIASAVTDYIYTVYVQEGRAVRTEHSPACEFVTGYTVEEFNANPFLWFSMVVDEDRQSVREYFNKVLIGEHEVPIEHRIYHKNGSIRWVVNMPVVHRNEAGVIISYDGVLSDITERKRAEEALKESEERYRLMAELTGKLVYDYDVPTGQITWHGAISQFTGFMPQEVDAIDVKAFNEMIHPEDRAETIAILEAALNECGPYSAEYRLRRKDGSYIFVEDHGVFLPDEKGRAVRMLGGLGDISVRKQAEEVIREAEKRYRTLFESANDAIFIMSGDKFIECNQMTLKMFGCDTKDDIFGRRPWEFSPSRQPDGRDSREKAKEYIHTAFEGTPQRFYWKHIHKDGTPFDAEVSLNRIELGDQSFIQAMVRDITERKRVEEALRESEERFRSLIQSSSDIIVILDQNGLITYESPSMEQILKYPAGKMIGKNPMDYMHPEDIGGVVKALAEVFEDVNPGIPSEFRFKRADGTWVYLEAIGNNLIDYPGINGVVITARDITERKKGEELKLDMERRLLHAQKLESLGVMAGGIAHDFNNLLMAILGNLDLARLDLSPVSRSRPFIDQALVAARRAADLTNQMLAYSGKGRFDLKPFDLSELVQEMAHLLKASISKTVTLNLQMNGDLPSIVADPSQIQQIIMNLIVNASEAIGEHPGVVAISTGSLDCDPGYLQRSRLKEKPAPGAYVFIEVRDTGCGMDEETKDRLFDPFFTTKFTGRGLGMAAVLGIVSGHKGAIMVESEQGRGAAIRVMFPASEGGKTVKGKKPGVSAMEGEGTAMGPISGTVLVADDEDMVRDLCKSMIERLGYKAITASDGEEAVKIFRENASEIVCVILDLTMPKLDGIAAFDEIRQIKADVKVILSSGYDEQETTERFTGKGLAGFIKKPYQLSILRAELGRVLKDL
ncbi:MAG: PAS domain S-box protein [Desulfomonilia bacterium]